MSYYHLKTEWQCNKKLLLAKAKIKLRHKKIHKMHTKDTFSIFVMQTKRQRRCDYIKGLPLLPKQNKVLCETIMHFYT